MKNILRSIALSIVSAPCLTGAVIGNTNIVLSDSVWTGADYALTVYQDHAGTDPTTILFKLSESVLTFVNTNIDEGSDWYFASFGNEFSDVNIQANLFQVFVRGTNSGFETNEIDVGYGSFYLGVNTGKMISGNDPFPPRNLYGWVHLQNSDGNLTMLGNAMSYQGPGIIVGTTQAIPEPSSLTLLLGLAATITCRRRR